MEGRESNRNRSWCEGLSSSRYSIHTAQVGAWITSSALMSCLERSVMNLHAADRRQRLADDLGAGLPFTFGPRVERGELVQRQPDCDDLRRLRATVGPAPLPRFSVSTSYTGRPPLRTPPLATESRTHAPK